jgi:hypothetical protein
LKKKYKKALIEKKLFFLNKKKPSAAGSGKPS